MIRHFFTAAYLLLAVPFAYRGLAAYFAADAGWDAGALGLFGAFWFVFGAAGFRARNPWMITMVFLAMTAFTALFLLVGFLESWNLGFAGTTSGPLLFPAGIVLLLVLIAGEIYALAAFRDKGTGTAGEAPPDNP
ncbi:MAG: hypothetical protein LJE65_06155 [Desulfobacteraceae bacterium]|jgi:hypothetical protein|nr:hypothetical protein [Desulfobacteraceae bacterium]